MLIIIFTVFVIAVFVFFSIYENRKIKKKPWTFAENELLHELLSDIWHNADSWKELDEKPDYAGRRAVKCNKTNYVVAYNGSAQGLSVCWHAVKTSNGEVIVFKDHDSYRATSLVIDSFLNKHLPNQESTYASQYRQARLNKILEEADKQQDLFINEELNQRGKTT